MILPVQSAPKTLLTIGYEGLDLDQFLSFLTVHDVDILVDVREIPLSRKKGFSKTKLSQALTSRGIVYQHIRALGSPTPLRKSLKHDWNYTAFFAAYDAYLGTQVEALKALTALIEKYQHVCLLCFEKAHEQCHRSRVAERVTKSFPEQLTVEPVRTWA